MNINDVLPYYAKIVVYLEKFDDRLSYKYARAPKEFGFVREEEINPSNLANIEYDYIFEASVHIRKAGWPEFNSMKCRIETTNPYTLITLDWDYNKFSQEVFETLLGINGPEHAINDVITEVLNAITRNNLKTYEVVSES